MFSQKWGSCVFVSPKFIFISSCHSLLSWIITHNFLLSLSEPVKSLGFIYPIQYHTFITALSATILYKYVCLSAFNMLMLPLRAPPFTTRSSRSRQLLHFISPVHLSVSAESAATTTSVRRGDLSHCSSGQKPPPSIKKSHNTSWQFTHLITDIQTDGWCPVVATWMRFCWTSMTACCSCCHLFPN